MLNNFEGEEVVEVVEEEVVDTETEEVEEETIESLKKKLATTVAQKEHWREKASKPKEDAVVMPQGSLSSSDLLAVMNAKVHEDDMERVEKFAKMEGTSIKEALKNPELKAILNLREEQRNTANATNVTNVRRGTTKVSDEQIIANANQGKIPDDDDGIARLVAAKRKFK